MDSYLWKEVQPNVFQRPCTGQEHSASFNQNIADGHTELSLSVKFDINVKDQDELEERLKLAWKASRIRHPEIALELSTDMSTPQMMIYRLLEDEEQINKWIKDTLIICNKTQDCDKVTEMTYNRRLPTIGKQSMLYFIPANKQLDSQSKHCIVWNVSHAITDAFSIIAFLNDLMEEAVLAKPGSGQSRLSDKPRYALERLPASLVGTYLTKFQPSKEDEEDSISSAREQVALYEKKLPYSVAMKPRSDHASRNHFTHCLFDKFSKAESRRIIKNLKTQKMSVTFAAAAATILAVLDLYGTGKEEGALLGMTRNARRWLNTQGIDGGAAIPMATDVVFLWIPFDEDVRIGSNINRVLALAKRIRQELSPHLRGPHYMASMQLMCNEYVDNLRKSITKGEKSSSSDEKEEVPASPPGFSPQGVLELNKTWESEGVKVIRSEFHHTGRQVNASPWIGMFSLDEQLNISIGFDEKYYEPEVIADFFARYKTKLLDLSLMNESHQPQSRL